MPTANPLAAFPSSPNRPDRISADEARGSANARGAWGVSSPATRLLPPPSRCSWVDPHPLPKPRRRLGDRRTLAEQLGRILARDATFAVPEPALQQFEPAAYPRRSLSRRLARVSLPRSAAVRLASPERLIFSRIRSRWCSATALSAAFRPRSISPRTAISATVRTGRWWVSSKMGRQPCAEARRGRLLCSAYGCFQRADGRHCREPTSRFGGRPDAR